MCHIIKDWYLIFLCIRFGKLHDADYREHISSCHGRMIVCVGIIPSIKG